MNAEAKTPAAKKEAKLGTRIATYGEYLLEARDLLKKNNGTVNGMTKPSEIAYAILYAKNEVIDQIVIKGETRLVVKA